MKDQEDKRIQDLFNKGLVDNVGNKPDQESTDEKAYSLIYEALSTSPDYPIKADFASKITEKVLPLTQQKASNADTKMLVIISILVLCVSLITLWFFGYNYSTNLNLSTNLLSILGIGITLMIAVQIADQKFVRPRISKL